MSVTSCRWVDGVLQLQGAIDFETAMAIEAEGLAIIRARAAAGDTELCIDLQGVERSGSVALALLASWHRQAHTCPLHLRWRGLPESLQALARLSQVAHWLEHC